MGGGGGCRGHRHRFVLFDGPQGRRRRLALETVVEDTPGGQGRPPWLLCAGTPETAARPWVWGELPPRATTWLQADEVARADVYAGLHERIDARPAGDVGDAGDGPGVAGQPPADARFYGPNARADQELPMMPTGSARRDSAWVDLPLPGPADGLRAPGTRSSRPRTGPRRLATPRWLAGARLFPRRAWQQTGGTELVLGAQLADGYSQRKTAKMRRSRPSTAGPPGAGRRSQRGSSGGPQVGRVAGQAHGPAGGRLRPRFRWRRRPPHPPSSPVWRPARPAPGPGRGASWSR